MGSGEARRCSGQIRSRAQRSNSFNMRARPSSVCRSCVLPLVLVLLVYYFAWLSIYHGQDQEYMQQQQQQQRRGRNTPSFKEMSEYANNKIVWSDSPDQLLLEESDKRAKDSALKILHVINPYVSGSGETQRLAMATLESARYWADMTLGGGDRVHVDIVAIENDKQSPMLPNTFRRSKRRLFRTAVDALGPEKIAAMSNISTDRIIFPLLSDIFEIAHEEATQGAVVYDLVVYSNMDINVLPHFYAIIAEMSKCYKSFFINRVEIPSTHVSNPAQFHLGKSDSKLGEPLVKLRSLETAYQYGTQFAQLHPGYDCFVVAANRLPAIAKLVGSVYVGHPPVGAVLAEAALIVDHTCITARHLPATFHVGSRNGEWQGDTEQLTSLNGKISRLIKHRSRRERLGKCRQKTIRSRGPVTDKCYPGLYYPLPQGSGAYMFPQDYNDSTVQMAKKIDRSSRLMGRLPGRKQS